MPDGIAWFLEKAMCNEPDGGRVPGVNETNVSKGETSGFRIEVLTGADAKAFFRDEMWENRSAFLAEPLVEDSRRLCRFILVAPLVALVKSPNGATSRRGRGHDNHDVTAQRTVGPDDPSGERHAGLPCQ